jgi:biotin carboxyl carrier protein
VVGVVVRITARGGRAIPVDDPLLVPEAMTTDTVIAAPAVGKMAKVSVNAGDAVQQGQVLVEFE